MNIKEAIEYGRCQLIENNIIDSPKLDVKLLLEYILNKSSSWMFIHDNVNLSTEDENKYLSLIKRRCLGEPIAYIIGHRDFWNLTLECDPCTLIPQPDTEILVETTLNVISNKSKILDLGTGTGAIALALKSENPRLIVEGCDFIDEIILLARRNAKKNKLDVNFFKSDWFSNVNSIYDVIVSNPPYIAEFDKHLKIGDVRFEPSTALISKSNGIHDLKHIISNAPFFLNNKGILLVEHGFDQGNMVRNLFLENNYNSINTIKDYGGNERVTYGYKTSQSI